MPTPPQPAVCRICTAYCPILVTVEDGRAMKVTGDPEAPLYEGYTCPKGRALPEQHNAPQRLLHSRKRTAAGELQTIVTTEAIAEIALRLQDIIARHGPSAVAVYTGMGSVVQPLGAIVANAWTRAVGTPMFFTANSIDKPGVQVATALHGAWRAGQRPFETAGAWIVVGANPIISKAPGWPQNNPGVRLKEAHARGMQLVVIDPRRTETARKAQLHLQPRPGHDAEILAAIVHTILQEQRYDRVFVESYAEGLGALREAVAPFAPEAVAERAGIAADQIRGAARLFSSFVGTGSHAGITCGTGPSFALHGSLCEYLSQCLTTLCGYWPRAGEPVLRPNVLLPPWEARAEPVAPYRAFGTGPRMRVRGLGRMAAGMPTAALADEILLEGKGQVRALLCIGGNPMMAWPDQERAHAALRKLDLLVTMDWELTATARLSHYVLAPKLSLETSFSTQSAEAMKYLGPSRGLDQPYARFAPPVVQPPPGADVIEEWEFFWRLAQHMKLPLQWVNYYGWGKHTESPGETLPLDMERVPSTDELWELSSRHSRVPLERVRAYPHGHVFEDAAATILPADPACEARLQLGDPTMLQQLRGVGTQTGASAEFPLLLVPRRLNNVLNSWGRSLRSLGREAAHNLAYLHPDDLAAAGSAEGDIAVLRSAHSAITVQLAVDANLRPGVVSMAHGFGDNPAGPADHDPRLCGSNTGRLVSADSAYDPITGLPRMGALPVRLEALHPAKETVS